MKVGLSRKTNNWPKMRERFLQHRPELANIGAGTDTALKREREHILNRNPKYGNDEG
jgi:hypothetical protein